MGLEKKKMKIAKVFSTKQTVFWYKNFTYYCARTAIITLESQHTVWQTTHSALLKPQKNMHKKCSARGCDAAAIFCRKRHTVQCTFPSVQVKCEKVWARYLKRGARYLPVSFSFLSAHEAAARPPGAPHTGLWSLQITPTNHPLNGYNSLPWRFLFFCIHVLLYCAIPSMQ